MDKKKFSGSTLKLIAIILMAIDHLGAIVVPVLYSKGLLADYIDWEIIYQVLRSLGRLSFPLFCFLLVEGYLHTSNKWKYLSRLFVFALVSEVCFDIAFYGKWFYLGKQNIFFELALGILLMSLTDYIEDRVKNNFVKPFFIVVIWCVGMLIAEFFELDYGMKGILSIGILYLFRRYCLLQVLGGAASFLWELPAPLAFLFVWFYNGKRGNQKKYLFYLFYPIHLLFFALIRWLLSCV